MPEILVVEDETNLARFIELELSHEGYSVTVAADGQEGFNLAYDNNYDAILLDLMLPKLNGLEVCRKLRKTKNTPIIIITAKGETYDKVVGLDYGADDYGVKPFAIEELLARLRVIMRRNQSVEVNHDTINIHDIEIDTTAYTVSIEGTPIDLTKTEHELLYLLVKNKGIVMKREQILDVIWGYDSEVETNVVEFTFVIYVIN